MIKVCWIEEKELVNAFYYFLILLQNIFLNDCSIHPLESAERKVCDYYLSIIVSPFPVWERKKAKSRLSSSVYNKSVTIVTPVMSQMVHQRLSLRRRVGQATLLEKTDTNKRGQSKAHAVVTTKTQEGGRWESLNSSSPGPKATLTLPFAAVKKESGNARE